MRKLFYLSLCLLATSCTNNSELDKLKRENEELSKIVEEYNNLKKDNLEKESKEKEEKEYFKQILVQTLKNYGGNPYAHHIFLAQNIDSDDSKEKNEASNLIGNGLYEVDPYENGSQPGDYCIRPTNFGNKYLLKVLKTKTISGWSTYGWHLKGGEESIHEITAIDKKSDQQIEITYSTILNSVTPIGESFKLFNGQIDEHEVTLINKNGDYIVPNIEEWLGTHYDVNGNNIFE